jgi:hypothetical protein
LPQEQRLIDSDDTMTHDHPALTFFSPYHKAMELLKLKDHPNQVIPCSGTSK